MLFMCPVGSNILQLKNIARKNKVFLIEDGLKLYFQNTKKYPGQ